LDVECAVSTGEKLTGRNAAGVSENIGNEDNLAIGIFRASQSDFSVALPGSTHEEPGEFESF
jgi:hypothetical protein